jgi:hypothetical protein
LWEGIGWYIVQNAHRLKVQVWEVRKCGIWRFLGILAINPNHKDWPELGAAPNKRCSFAHFSTVFVQLHILPMEGGKTSRMQPRSTLRQQLVILD